MIQINERQYDLIKEDTKYLKLGFENNHQEIVGPDNLHIDMSQNEDGLWGLEVTTLPNNK